MWPFRQDNHVEASNTCEVRTWIHSLYTANPFSWQITQVCSSRIRTLRVHMCFFCPLQSYQVHGDDLLISQRGFSSDHSRPFQILYTQPFIFSDDVSDLIPVWQHVVTQSHAWPSNSISFHCHHLQLHAHTWLTLQHLTDHFITY